MRGRDRRRPRWGALAGGMVAVATSLLLVAGPAAAGQYRVHACSGFSGANPGFGAVNGNYQSWNECATPGWYVMGTNASVNRAYYPGEEGGWILYAPAGTSFTGVTVNAREQRWNDTANLGFGLVCHNRWDRCSVAGNGVFLKEPGSGQSMLGISNVPNGQWSPWRTYSWSAGFGPAADAVKLGLFCFAWGRPNCNNGPYDATLAQFSAFTLDVADNHAPGGPTVGGSLVGEAWRRGTLDLSGTASDLGGGVSATHYRLGGSTVSGEAAHSCARLDASQFFHVQPCPGSAGYAFSVGTAGLVPDGERQLEVWSTDAAGNRGPSTTRTVRIDNTAPAAPTGVAVDGGEEWRSSRSFTVRWTNPTGQHAPVARAHYKLCKAGGSCVETGPRGGPDIAALEGVEPPSRGEWQLQVYLEDAAGNADPARVSEVAHLRFDDERPERVEFVAPDPDDPQRLRFAVADRVSGIAGGSIEMRSEGGPWQALPTTLEVDHLVARIDDASLEPGFYEFRAIARDRAGNERSSLDGPQSLRRLYLPLRLRAKVALSARRPTCAQLRAAAASRSRRGCKRGRVRVGRGSVRLGFRSRALVRGRAQTLDGVPIGNVPIIVLYRHRSTDARFRQLAELRADPQGRFEYLLPAGPSGSYRFRYPGSERYGPGQGELVTLVRAAVAFRASRHRARNGQTVVFSGRLRGAPVPAGGRTVAVQAFVPGAGWRTFATPRSDAKGRFRVPYRFRFTRGLQRYRLRALVERSGDYPYERAASRPVTVTVRGD
jgi:hypothetical protein